MDKQKVLISISGENLLKIDDLARRNKWNRSDVISHFAETYDYVADNFKNMLNMVMYNKDNMRIILESNPKYKDAQHVINSLILKAANQSMSDTFLKESKQVERGEDGFTKVEKMGNNDLFKSLIEKSRKAKGIEGYDTEGNPLYE